MENIVWNLAHVHRHNSCVMRHKVVCVGLATLERIA